jgi:hypothetical protein
MGAQWETTRHLSRLQLCLRGRWLSSGVGLADIDRVGHQPLYTWLFPPGLQCFLCPNTPTCVLTTLPFGIPVLFLVYCCVEEAGLHVTAVEDWTRHVRGFWCVGLLELLPGPPGAGGSNGTHGATPRGPVHILSRVGPL